LGILRILLSEILREVTIKCCRAGVKVPHFSKRRTLARGCDLTDDGPQRQAQSTSTYKSPLYPSLKGTYNQNAHPPLHIQRSARLQIPLAPHIHLTSSRRPSILEHNHAKSRQRPRRPLRPAIRMALWRQAGREAAAGGVGEYLGLWVLWEFVLGGCGVCF
jgi:hypothetical protein